MGQHYPEIWKRTKPILQTDFLSREPIPEWLGDVKDKIVLDAGCGEGYVARKLVKTGAKVKAFDKDPKMIKIAKSFGDELNQGIEYKIGDIFDVKKLYKNQKFDIALLSGIAPFLDKDQLPEVCRLIYDVLHPKGILLLTTNHARSYFEKAKSNWIKFLSEPDPKLPTQLFNLNFFTPDGKKAFSGECWIHTPEKLTESIESAGFKIEKVYEMLATKYIAKNFPDMWIDEKRMPFHISIIARK